MRAKLTELAASFVLEVTDDKGKATLQSHVEPFGSDRDAALEHVRSIAASHGINARRLTPRKGEPS